jgi:hypothetical protein
METRERRMFDPALFTQQSRGVAGADWHSPVSTANSSDPAEVVSRRADAPKPVFRDFAAEGVAVHAEEVGGFPEVAVGIVQDMGDEAFLELPLGVFIANAPGDHVLHEPLELFA